MFFKAKFLPGERALRGWSFARAASSLWHPGCDWWRNRTWACAIGGAWKTSAIAWSFAVVGLSPAVVVGAGCVRRWRLPSNPSAWKSTETMTTCPLIRHRRPTWTNRLLFRSSNWPACQTMKIWCSVAFAAWCAPVGSSMKTLERRKLENFGDGRVY